jgi:hypothetical protein
MRVRRPWPARGDGRGSNDRLQLLETVMADEMEIKEELRWIFVIYRWGKVWGEYATMEEAQTAIANIKTNESAMKK